MEANRKRSSEKEMKYDINSQEYWNNRFQTDWQEYSGNEQTKYFASILVDMLPDWLLHEANESGYEICDLGCAQGDALPIYQQKFMASKIYGEDFSEQAIEIAQKTYPEFSFKVSDILNPENERKYPIIICSNVVEHFRETYKILSKIFMRTEKYAIIMIPYREEFGAIDEHEQVFHTKDIPLMVGDYHLVYSSSIDCSSIYYPYEQILLIYTRDKKFAFFSDLVEHVSSDREKKKDKAIEKLQEEAVSTANQLTAVTGELANTKKQLIDTQKQLTNTQKQLIDTASQLAEKTTALDDATSQLEANAQLLTQAQQNYLMAMALVKQKDEHILQAQSLCNNFATGKLMKLNHFLFRLKGQLLRGNKEQRKDFWSWLGGRIKRTNRSLGAGTTYNPWMVVNEKLKEAVACQVNFSSSASNVPVATKDLDPLACGETLPTEIKQRLAEDYTKYDVIILSVIDYNFRHQRPQHFATRYASNGHRVFYVNANFVRPDSVSKEMENLYVVDFSCADYNAIYPMDGKSTLNWMKEKLDWLIYSQAIRDAIVVVDYPNWVYGAEFIREKYGFKIITDYMDDYTGFLGTAEDFLKNNCIRLLQSSDAVAASSQFLYEVAAKHTEAEKISIIRNGTEVTHFYQATHMKTANKERKIIGYYGAVSHWFAWEKVCYLAEKSPDCDVVIVGEVTEHREKLEKYENIKLLGEKPYAELPKYLADFDVCLIPFDTSTDLIKATNPVKFYEYLSAGKKVVATEIPELLPYRDQYVYMSNDNEKFAEYVHMCLAGTDALQDADSCIAFARENDWQKRYEAFEQECSTMIPKVSIIVLTYNNEDMNRQCIESILSKTAYANYELIVVDNHSTDGTVDYLQQLKLKDIPNVSIILNKENLGFAGGNNCGIECAKGDYILLLNNDTVVTRGWITNMVNHLEKNNTYGMCNPVTNSIGNESQIAVRYTNMAELDAFAYSYTSVHMGEEYTDVDRLPLFATLIRRSVIDQVGLLDTQYKIGMFEDDDFTAAVTQAGHKIIIAEDAFVHHVNNASFKKLSDVQYQKIFNENRTIYEKKWGVKWQMPRYRAGVDATINSNVSV